MLANVIEAAAELAETSEPTVEAALVRYRLHISPKPTACGQLWVSVAFLVHRHEQIREALPKH